MSSVQLLDKTRKIGKLLHNNNSSKVVFNDICSVLCEILDSNVLVISKKGKVLGVGDCEGVESITELIVDQVGGFIDGMLNERLLAVLSTKENVNLETLGFVPAALAPRIRAVGNTALDGAALLALHNNKIPPLARLCSEAVVLPLVDEPNFHTDYLRRMRFGV